MHPAIHEPLAKARTADMHREAERLRTVRIARRARLQGRLNTTTRRRRAVLERLRALITGGAPERAS